MAFQTGSQIRPELSAVNYAPFLQAATQSAQMQAQGIAELGKGLTKGFESYVQQQKENKQLESEIKSAEKLGKALQPFLAQINPEAGVQVNALLSSIADPEASLRDRSAVAKNIGASLNNILNLAQLGKQTQDVQKSAEYEQILRSGGGKVPTPFAQSAIEKFTPEQRMLGEERYLKGAKTKAEIGELEAKAQALRTPKVPDLSYQEQAIAVERAAFKEKFNRPPTAAEDAELFAKVAKMSKPETNVTVGEGAAANVYNKLESRKEAVDALKNVSASYDAAIEEITKSGAFSGPTGALKYAGARALQFFGANTFKDEADAYQAAASSIANAVLSYARRLPGSASDKDVAFLERVASGGERVASVESLRKLKARVDRNIKSDEAYLNARINAFGESIKGDKNMEFYHRMLTAKPSETQSGQGTIFDQADAIISR